MSEITEVEIKNMTKEQNYLRGYADGRQDAISLIEEKLLDLELFADNDYWSNNRSMMWKTEEVREILEQLKGK